MNTEQTETPLTAQAADVKPLKSISSIWLIPFIAVLIGGWMVYYQWSNEGPLITIQFESAEGMEAGKTKIKSRHVNVGEVTAISLNDGSAGVTITARLAKNAAHLLIEDTDFWVVSPQITHTGVSGLSTLISGVYIEVSPGVNDQKRTDFIALVDPPVTPAGTPGLHITLNSNDQFAYSKGDPIIYKGLTVGRFEDIYFNFEERIVYYNAFIKAPYHELVTSNTKFWDVSGLQLDLTADGLSVNTGNFETLLTNGVTFDVPEGMAHGKKITERTDFNIYDDYKTASDERYKESIKYVVFVSDSIRGLRVGAPVEYRGIHVGQVESVDMLQKQDKTNQPLFTDAIKIPVLVSFQPGRVGLPDNQQGVARMQQQHRLWVKQGLKASLKTGNLLTGSLFIDMQHYPDQPVDTIDQYGDYAVIPTIDDGFSQITKKAGQFMDSLNDLPLERISGNANQLMEEFTQTAKALTDTAKELQGASKNLEALLSDANQQQVSQQLADALKNVATLTRDISAGSTGYEDLRKTLSAMTQAMHELRPLLKQLKHQPNGLVFDPGTQDPIEPKKHSGDPQ
ncbi:MAG: intermembrane transport protein PqiB [Algicola sp.]|nr:intermembrane transport protein PqiB [Algicola sp.]